MSLKKNVFKKMSLRKCLYLLFLLQAAIHTAVIIGHGAMLLGGFDATAVSYKVPRLHRVVRVVSHLIRACFHKLNVSSHVHMFIGSHW